VLEFMKLYADMEQLFEPYSQEEKGNLLDAMMAYCFKGEEPNFTGNERFIWPVLRRHFIQCAERAETLRANAAKGGRPRKQKGSEESKPEPEETKEKPNETNENQTKPNETKNKLEQEQEQEHIQEQEQEHKQEQKRARAVDAKFEIFWKAYPRKVGKGFAQKSFEKVKPDDALFATILKALERAKTSAQWTKDGGQYIPNPATWLNQRRWEDEPAQAVQQPSDYQRRQYDSNYFSSLEVDLDA